MTSKERVIAMLQHKTPDRVPHGQNAFDSDFYTELTGKKNLCYAGWEEKESLWAGNRQQIVQDYVDSLCDMAENYGCDYIRVPFAPPAVDYSGYKRLDAVTYRDDKGKEFVYNPKVGSVICPKEYNVEMTIDDLPDPDSPFYVDDSELDIARGVVERIGKSHFILGRLKVDGSFPYQSTVGMEEYLVRMILEPEFVHKANQLFTNRCKVHCKMMLEAGCDGVMLTADYADTRGLIMGKDRFDTFVRPYLKEITDYIHGLGGFVIKHTDGAMFQALPDLAEIGVDAWHGVQPSLGLTLKRIRQLVGDRLCVFGGINAETYVEGPEEKIRQEVRDAVEFGAAGGLVLTSGNVLEPGSQVPLYRASLDELEKVGKLQG